MTECIFCGPDHPDGLRHSDAEIRAYERGRAARSTPAEALACEVCRKPGHDAEACPAAEWGDLAAQEEAPLDMAMRQNVEAFLEQQSGAAPRAEGPDLMPDEWPRADPAAPSVDELDGIRSFLTGQTRHRYMGSCPDELEGPDVRDPECNACEVTDTILRRLSGAPQEGTDD